MIKNGALALRRNLPYRRCSELCFPRYVIAAKMRPHLAITAYIILNRFTLINDICYTLIDFNAENAWGKKLDFAYIYVSGLRYACIMFYILLVTWNLLMPF